MTSPLIQPQDQLELLEVKRRLDISGKVVGSAESDEHYTPSSVFAPLHREFRFTLDVCATKESAKVPKFFDLARNGLHDFWTGERVWCNPPYSNIAPWVEHAAAAVGDRLKQIRAELVVQLLPAWTDRAWWQEWVEPNRDGRGLNLVETRFLKRIRFGTPGDPEGLKSGSPAFWPVLLIWRPR